MTFKVLFLNLMTLARTRGCFLLSTPSPTGAGAGSAPTPSGRNCATSTTTTRTCGPGCCPSRPFPAKQRKSSTAHSDSRTSTPCSGWRTAKRPPGRRHSRPLLVLPGFSALLLLGIVNSFSRQKLVWLLSALPQNHDEEDERNDEIRAPPRAGKTAFADHHGGGQPAGPGHTG